MAKKKAAGDIVLDMSKVESGGKRRFPEGDYLVQIKSVKTNTNENSGNPQLIVQYEITEGKFKGQTITDYMTLTEKALWRVGNLLDALGIKWKKAKFKIPKSELVDGELGITLVDDEYQGKIKSKISDFLDLETAKSAIEDDDEDDDDEDEDDDDDDLDEDDDV